MQSQRWLKWVISTLKELDSELLAHKMVLANYPTIVKAALPEAVKFDVEEQARLLQVSIQMALQTPRLVEVMEQKYDAWLARIQERPDSYETLQQALKDFENWGPQGPIN